MTQPRHNLPAFSTSFIGRSLDVLTSDLRNEDEQPPGRTHFSTTRLSNKQL